MFTTNSGRPRGGCRRGRSHGTLPRVKPPVTAWHVATATHELYDVVRLETRG
jgi:hypothetical protein